jgi:hypothetical protein
VRYLVPSSGPSIPMRGFVFEREVWRVGKGESLADGDGLEEVG